MQLVHAINYAAVAAALSAGYLWWIASRVKYPSVQVIAGEILGGLSRKDEHVLVDALNKSGRLNSRAALASSVAAILSAFGLTLGIG